jgi:hypothetical protein
MSEPTKSRRLAHHNPTTPPSDERTDQIPAFRSSQRAPGEGSASDEPDEADLT